MERIFNDNNCLIIDIQCVNGTCSIRPKQEIHEKSVVLINNKRIAYADNMTNEEKDFDGLLKIAKSNCIKNNAIENFENVFSTSQYINYINTEDKDYSKVKHYLLCLYEYATNRTFKANNVEFLLRVIDINKMLDSSFGAMEFLQLFRYELYIVLERVECANTYRVHDFIDGDITDVLSYSHVLKRIDKAFDDLEKKIHANPLLAASYKCLIDASFTGILIHEAIGHVSEADTFLKRQESGNIGMLFESRYYDEINIMDCANKKDGVILPSPVFLDNQAICANDTIIMKNGRFREKLHNLETAFIFNETAKGNARTIYRNLSIIRMRNTILLPGTNTEKEILSSIEDGVYLCTPGKGMVDKTGFFVIEIVVGYVVKYGKIVGALEDCVAYGKIEEFLRSVDMVADSIRVTGAFCRKGLNIYVGMGGPALRCELNIINRRFR